MISISYIDSYPVPNLLIPRIAKEYDYSIGYATGALREAKRMLFMSAQTGKPFAPSALVDPAWHEMMLFTRFYQEFADTIGSFIHHDPTPGEPDGGALYEQTKKDYEEFFGQKPDPQFWP
ncbi:MAG: hypothetical protein AAB439_04020 [Patescibacteria group bacterium]